MSTDGDASTSSIIRGIAGHLLNPKGLRKKSSNMSSILSKGESHPKGRYGSTAPLLVFFTFSAAIFIPPFFF
jgi:hypothetical protein